MTVGYLDSSESDLPLFIFMLEIMRIHEEHSMAAKSLFKECGDTYGDMVTSFWLMNVYDKTEEEALFHEEVKTVCKAMHSTSISLFPNDRNHFLVHLICRLIYPLFIQSRKS